MQTIFHLILFDVLGWLFDLERGRAFSVGTSAPRDIGDILGQKDGVTRTKTRKYRAISSKVFSSEGGDLRWDRTTSTASKRCRKAKGALLWKKADARSSGLPTVKCTKQKRHTRKHITGSTRTKRVMLLSEARAGKIQDKRQLDEADLVSNIPDLVRIEGDLGFQGWQNEFVNIHLPHTKLRGNELSDQQQQENKKFSSQRVVCEHAHAGIKRYNSVSAIYRNRVPDFDDHLMLTAAGLWNFYLEAA